MLRLGAVLVSLNSVLALLNLSQECCDFVCYNQGDDSVESLLAGWSNIGEVNLVLRVRRDPQGVGPKTTVKSHHTFLSCDLLKAVEKSFVL